MEMLPMNSELPISFNMIRRIIDDTVKKPIPTYWIGKKIWDHMITETDNSFDPSFFIYLE